MTSSDGCAMAYDSAGNQTYDCVGTHSYDAENRMTKAVQGSSNNYYFYDGSGKRVRRILNGSQTWGRQETWFAYGFDGELAAEYAYNQVTAPLATAPQKARNQNWPKKNVSAPTKRKQWSIVWSVMFH